MTPEPVDDRYERRLIEETATLRLEAAAAEMRLIDRMSQSEAGLRQEMNGLRGEVNALRQETRDEFKGVQKEIGQVRLEIADVRVEVAGTRLEIAALRTELTAAQSSTLKWAFGFWVGQFATTAALLALFR